jgi:predicted ATPase
MKKIVLKGGTYAGKSTLLSHFAAEGHTVVPEAGQIIIAELNEKLGMEQQKKWRAENPIEFYERIIAKQEELEASATAVDGKIMFLDRGIPDYLAFLRLVNVEIPKHLWDMAQKHAYKLTIICEVLSSFSDRAETGRSLNREASIKLQTLVSEVYQELGQPTLFITEAPIEQRIQLINTALADPALT